MLASAYFSTKNIKFDIYLNSDQLQVSVFIPKIWNMIYICDWYLYVPIFLFKISAQYILKTLSVADTYFLIKNIKHDIYLQRFCFFVYKNCNIKIVAIGLLVANRLWISIFLPTIQNIACIYWLVSSRII